MEVGPSRSAHGAFAAVISERRIYIRTDRGTAYLALSPLTQAIGLLLVTALLGWTAFASTAYVTRALDAHSAASRLETQRTAYEARLAALGERQRALEEELAQANSRRDAVTARLSDKQARLVESSARLQAATAELAALRARVETLTAARRDEATRIAALESEISAHEAALAATETEKDNLDTAFDTFSAAMEKVIAERDSAAAEASELRLQVAALSGNLGSLKDRQQRLLSRLEDAARTTFAGLKSLFARSDLDLERILAEARRDHDGAGGPFVPLAEAEEARTAEGDRRVAALMQELETVNLMRLAADRLPFGEPARGTRLTSDFGPRRDPKGRGRALHEGLDLAGPRGTPIMATADGIVTFAGRQSGYGIMVKIRHAFGFETVYAHLNRARVKVGQHVARGERIGDMGSTGRSTGTHVHYEVRIDDKPVNPLKFIEAARDVL